MGKLYEDGWGMMRNSTASFHVRPEYAEFVGIVGACQVNGGPYYILQDDEVVWEREALVSTEPAAAFRIEIPPGTKKLTIKTGSEGGYDGYSAGVNAGFLVRDVDDAGDECPPCR